MDPVIITVVVAAVVQVVGLVGAAWGLASRLATMQATMVTRDVCESRHGQILRDENDELKARIERLDSTGPVRLSGGA